MTAGRVEARFARLFLKLAEQIGRLDRGGIFVAMPLTRKELADLTGTTIETTIRTMSRWQKDDVMRTEKDGSVIVDRSSLESTAESQARLLLRLRALLEHLAGGLDRS